MQEHQKENHELKHEQKKEVHDKQDAQSYKDPLIINQIYHYSPTPANLGPMRTSYLSGASSFAGSFEALYNKDAEKMMGLSDKIIIDSFNAGVLKGKGIYSVHYNDPINENQYWFRYNTYAKPLAARWKPVKIEIFDIKIQSTFIAQKFFTNHLDRQVVYRAQIIYQTEQTDTSEWNKQFSVSLGASASAGVDIKFISAGITIETSVTTTIGMSESFSKAVTLGTTSGVDVPVKPFESIRIELSASLGTAKARVTYEVQLDGHILAKGRTQNSATQVAVPSSYFEFNKKATVDQIVKINSYGKDYIQTFPWDPTSKK